MRRSIVGSASLPAALSVVALALGTLLTAVPSYAQSTSTSSAPVTRAQVRAELEELVNAGYNPRDWYHYPDNLQAAERVVQQRHEALAQEGGGAASHQPEKASSAGQNEAVGGVAGTKSETGTPARDRGAWQSDGAPCVYEPGCSIYFGH